VNLVAMELARRQNIVHGSAKEKTGPNTKPNVRYQQSRKIKSVFLRGIESHQIIGLFL
jgi:hypothetical protein